MRARLATGLIAAAFSASLIVAGPAAPEAHADDFNPCNLPGGAYACQKVMDGTKWSVENTGVKSVVETTASVADFASDPLGYINDRLRVGTEGMFKAFGEELSGGSSDSPKNGQKAGTTKGG